MTAEEAIEILSDVGDINRCCAEDAEALDMAIKALEAQPCEDAVSRQEAISAIIEEFYPNAIAIDIVDTIANLPSVTPKLKIGRWIDIQYFKADDTYYRPKCPFCGIEPKEYSNYCPNCGADMRESEDKI